MLAHPTYSTLQMFQIERLRRALLGERIAATPQKHRLAVRCIYSLYRSCVDVGAKAEADELCAQIRQIRAYDDQEKPVA